MAKQNTHLRCLSNGRVFLYSETLATRSDMVPCDANGQIPVGHVGDVQASDASQDKRVTKFLGNRANGVLYPYTAILASRGDMIPIDTEEQWLSMQRNGEAPEVAPNTVAPVLSRTKEPQEGLAEDISPIPTIPAETIHPPKTQAPGAVPDTSGMQPREAKRMLAEWALREHETKVDQRQQLSAVVEVCEVLAENTLIASNFE